MENNTARFDLTLLLEENIQGLKGSLEYNRYLFEQESIARFVTDFQCVLEAIVDNPAIRIWDIPLRSIETSLLQKQTQETDDILNLFAAQVTRTPHAVAVSFADEQLTYEELAQRAHQLAYALRQFIIEPGACIGLALERSLDVVVGLLAILEAGGVYKLLDPTANQHDEDMSCCLIITTRRFMPRTQDQAHHSICLETLAMPTIATQDVNRSKDICIRDFAETHHSFQAVNLLSFFYFCSQRGWYGKDTRASAWSALTSELFLYELFLPLLSGGSVSIVPEEIRLDSRAYSAWLAREHITHAYLPSFVLSEIMLRIRQGQRFDLNTILFTNQISAEQQISELQHLLPHAHILNGYGVPGVVWVACYEMGMANASGRCTPIGRAIAPHRVYLLDSFMHPVPPGVVGEIYLAGSSVDCMYRDHSIEINERFIPDPFADLDGWLYKTGDFARTCLDGNLELIGREREGVTLRGVNVWPEEVAAVLTTCPGVLDAVVLVREDEERGKYLVAYIQPELESEHTALLKMLQTFSKDLLPASMVPSFFVILTQLPLDPNGGVRAAALPAPTREQGPAVADPQSKLERQIAMIWRKVLNINTVSIHDNFFDRGGHSLLLIRLHSELQTVLNLQLSIVDLFKYPTISALVKFVQQDQSTLSTQTEIQQLYTRVSKQKDALQRQKALSQERRTTHGTD